MFQLVFQIATQSLAQSNLLAICVNEKKLKTTICACFCLGICLLLNFYFIFSFFVQKKFWLHLQTQGIKIPKVIKILLQFTGYDNELSLTLLNQNSIQSIESYVEKNKSEAIKLQIAKENEQFKLKPGQISVILGLAQKCSDYLKKKEELQHNISDSNTLGNTENKNEKSEDKPRDKLINELREKLRKYMLKCSFAVQFSTKNISEFEIKTNGTSCTYRCRVKCCFCEKKYVCNYKTYWEVSNIEAHLKIHMNEISKTQRAKKYTGLDTGTITNQTPSQTLDQTLTSDSTRTQHQVARLNSLVNRTTHNATLNEMMAFYTQVLTQVKKFRQNQVYNRSTN